MGIRGDRRFPIVGRRTDHVLACPAGRRRGRGCLYTDRAGRFRRTPRVEPLLGQLSLLLRLGGPTLLPPPLRSRTLRARTFGVALGGGSAARSARGPAADRQDPDDDDGDDGRHDRERQATLHGNLLRGDVRGTVRPTAPPRN